LDKDHKIWDSSDSEFLSFLYAERDRENAMSAAWGINYWIVAAAILGLLGYAYSRISDNYDEFSWQLFTYYAVTLGAILMAIGTIVGPFLHNNRWKKAYRITTMAKNFPRDEIYGKYMISAASFLTLVQCLKDYGPITWMFLAIFLLNLGVQIYSTINGKKFVKVEPWGFVFSENWLERIYRFLGIFMSLWIVSWAILTWGAQFAMHEKEFEMGCVLTIIVAIWWITRNRIHEQKSDSIDDLIDKYLYGSLSKEDAYFCLQSYSQGFDIIDIISTVCAKVKPVREQLAERKKKHEEYRTMITEGRLNFDHSLNYLDYIEEDLTIAKNYSALVDVLCERMKEILQFDVAPDTKDTYEHLFNEIIDFQKDLMAYNKETEGIANDLIAFIEPYKCIKYGGLCGNLDCEERYEKSSLWRKIKINKTKKIRLFNQCGK